jgi:uncharacterized membrane protein YcaP (DUF421 family)
VQRVAIKRVNAASLVHARTAVRELAALRRHLVILLAAVRLMGKRVAGQMSVLELTVIVTLGAAIGVPLEVPERGILPAMIVLAIAILYQRGIGLLAFKSRRALAIVEGTPAVLVRDGALELDTMRRASISRERVFAMLRQQQFLHLGEVKRGYLEASGQLSVFRDDQPRPGLCLLPGQDQQQYEDQFAEAGRFACRSCGNVLDEPSEPAHACPHCDQHDWKPAVLAVSIRELR